MPNQVQPEHGRAAARSFALAVLILAVLGVSLEYPIAQIALNQARVYFQGPDDYMRVFRARQIADGSTLRVRFEPEINVPLGAELHWTAPMDYLVAGAGRLFGWFAWRNDPFGTVAAFVPLGLGVIYLLYMARVMRRAFGLGPAVLTAVLIVLTPPWHSVFCLGHPDHHCLLVLLLLAAVGPWIPRASADGTPGEPRTGAAVCSGLAIGLAIWVTVEATLFWAVMVIGLWAAATFGPEGQRRRYADLRLVCNLSAILTVTVGWLFENWPDLGAVAADRISLVHPASLAVGFLLPAGSPRVRPGRYVIFVAGAAVFAALLWAGRGRVFEYFSRPESVRWFSYLVEFQPLYARVGSELSLRPLHCLLGFVPYALPVLYVFFLRCRQVPSAMKYILGLLAPAIMLLAIRQVRWTEHYDLVVLPVVVVGAWKLAHALARHAGLDRPQTSSEATPLEQGRRADETSWIPLRPEPAAMGAFVLLALLVYPAAETMLSFDTAQAKTAAIYMRRTDFAAGRILACEVEHADPDSRRRAILCEEGEGPALLYWTGLPVVATPYHRALEGLLEMARFYAERDPAKAREQLDRLGVRYVVMPHHANEQLMQCEDLAFGELRSFDPPDRNIDEFGQEVFKLNYRAAEVSKTMAYRLVMEPRSEVIPGVELVADIYEGAKTRDGQPMKTGLVYVVHDLPPASRPEAPAREHSAE